MNRTVSLLTAALLALAGCSSHAIQTSSGADYLARYDPVPSAPRRVVQVSRDGSEQTIEVPSTDELVRQAAAVEPILKLPARIGLARIDQGALSAIPEAEAALWRNIAGTHAGLGEFVAVDPFIAEFTAQTLAPSDGYRHRASAAEMISKIRLGAARQHLDAVLVYEVGLRSGNESTAMSFTDITIIGGAFLPSRALEAEATARALMIDVRNGYPYGTASAAADVSELSPSWGSDRRERKLRDQAARQAVEKLAPEIDAMLGDLTEAMRGRAS